MQNHLLWPRNQARDLPDIYFGDLEYSFKETRHFRYVHRSPELWRLGDKWHSVVAVAPVELVCIVERPVIGLCGPYSWRYLEDNPGVIPDRGGILPS